MYLPTGITVSCGNTSHLFPEPPLIPLADSSHIPPPPSPCSSSQFRRFFFIHPIHFFVLWSLAQSSQWANIEKIDSRNILFTGLISSELSLFRLPLGSVSLSIACFTFPSLTQSPVSYTTLPSSRECEFWYRFDTAYRIQINFIWRPIDLRNCRKTYLKSILPHIYVTRRKVAGSIVDEIIAFFNSPNPYSSTMTLGSTKPLAEMSTKNFPWVKGRVAGA
jgi:hypothetical protein